MVENVVFRISYPTIRVQSMYAAESSNRLLIHFEQLVPGILTGIVLTVAAVRIAFQIHHRRRLYLSDVFLLCACICLCAGTVVLYHFEDMLYFEETLAKGALSASIPPDFLTKVETSFKYSFSYYTILWTSIFSVKFSFLSFFRPLVQRLARSRKWWTYVIVITALSWGFCTVGMFIICPRFDSTLCKCLILICCFWSHHANCIGVLKYNAPMLLPTIKPSQWQFRRLAWIYWRTSWVYLSISWINTTANL